MEKPCMFSFSFCYIFIFIAMNVYQAEVQVTLCLQSIWRNKSCVLAEHTEPRKKNNDDDVDNNSNNNSNYCASG